MCCDTHSTGRFNARPLHGDGDAVEKYNDQHNMIKHLVGYDLVAQDPKPVEKSGIVNFSHIG